MIKQLIEDLAYDNITLSQGLTRAKLIASKTRNNVLKEWVNRELQGYSNNDQLPEYRRIPCQTSIVIGLPFGAQDVTPVAVEDPDMAPFYNQYRLLEAVTHIESTIKDLANQINVTIQLPTNLAILLAQPFQEDIQGNRGGMRAVIQKFGKAEYEKVIELTKQTLLDTLLDLNEQFPNLENEFNATKDNLNKVENIVTNHIYGNNNPVNVAAGNNVEQKDIANAIGVTDYSKLESLGVEKQDIEELKQIIETNQNNKPARTEKVMKWVTPVITGASARGLYEAIPKIMDFAKGLIE